MRARDLQPDDVFTPATLPLKDGNAYVHRAEEEQALDRFLKRAQVPLVFGEYAVGKTTLVRRRLQDTGVESIYIGSPKGLAFKDVLATVLDKLQVTRITEFEESKSSSGEIGGNFIVGGKGAKGYSTREVRSNVVGDMPMARIFEIMRDREVTLIIDELHRASEEFRQDLVGFIRDTRGQESKWPQLVLIGTAPDASALVAIDPGTNRFVKELRVAPLTPEESRDLISSGFAALGITVTKDLVSSMVRTAAGAPALLQALCLDAAESCFDECRTSLHPGDLKKAVDAYLSENGNRLIEAYEKAVEHVGKKRYRKQILIAMSQVDSDYPELEEIRQNIERRLGESVPATALSGPLRKLKEGTDSILVDFTRHEGERVFNVSTFRDPVMKSFIRFINEVEALGLNQIEPPK